jgi:hypothetical protein
MNLLALCVSCWLASNQPEQCTVVPAHLLQEPRVSFSKTYTNESWGFVVAIPPGLTGYDQVTPPHHGIWFLLGTPPHAFVVAFGEANSLEFTSPRAAAEFNRKILREEGTDVVSSSLDPARLESLPAARVETHYRCSGDRTRHVVVSVIALDPKKSIRYEVSLRTTVERLKEDRQVLETILRSWTYIGR